MPYLMPHPENRIDGYMARVEHALLWLMFWLGEEFD